MPRLARSSATSAARLLAELDKLQFALYGTAQLGFPRSLTQDHILRVRAGAGSLYDYRNKFLRVSLTLTEALLFDRVRLTGGAAMLFRWGEHDEFAVTLGGFHPSFRPFIPAGLREPARLGATGIRTISSISTCKLLRAHLDQPAVRVCRARRDRCELGRTARRCGLQLPRDAEAAARCSSSISSSG